MKGYRQIGQRTHRIIDRIGDIFGSSRNHYIGTSAEHQRFVCCRVNSVIRSRERPRDVDGINVQRWCADAFDKCTRSSEPPTDKMNYLA